MKSIGKREQSFLFSSSFLFTYFHVFCILIGHCVGKPVSSKLIFSIRIVAVHKLHKTNLL